jgi:hypothetical protein
VNAVRDEPLLYRVNLAAWERVAAEEAWRRSIVLARESGHSLRQIADAAGVSHVRVLQLVRSVDSAGEIDAAS